MRNIKYQTDHRLLAAWQHRHTDTRTHTHVFFLSFVFFVLFLFFASYNLVLINQSGGSTTPACPCLTFFYKGSSELFLIFACAGGYNPITK